MTQKTKEELLDFFAMEAMKSLVSRASGLMNAYNLAGEAFVIAEQMVERRQKILHQWALAEDVVQRGIEELNLTARTVRCLKAEGVFTLQQLQSCTEGKLLRMPNFGRKSLNEIIEQMASFGYKLRDYT